LYEDSREDPFAIGFQLKTGFLRLYFRDRLPNCDFLARRYQPRLQNRLRCVRNDGRHVDYVYHVTTPIQRSSPRFIAMMSRPSRTSLSPAFAEVSSGFDTLGHDSLPVTRCTGWSR